MLAYGPHLAATRHRRHVRPDVGPRRDLGNKLAAIGCRTVHAGKAEALAGLPGFAGSIVVAMCNSHVMNCRGLLKDLGCRLVWVNCMTFLFDNEITAFRQHGPAEAFVFQSEFQRAELEKVLPAFGYDPGKAARSAGPLLLTNSPSPRARTPPATDFVIGRLARPDLDKWSSNHWHVLNRVPYAQRRAIAMGWTMQLTRKCGQPPAWAETLAPQEIACQDFLGRCHAMLGLNGGARENWPRIGLEAMAAGVPLVCQNQWGWKEMITDGQTGFLTGSDEEMAFRLAQLAYDEDLRQRSSITPGARSRIWLPGTNRAAVDPSLLFRWGRNHETGVGHCHQP